MLLLFFPFAARRQWLRCYAPSFSANPNFGCVTAPSPPNDNKCPQTPLKSTRNGKAELGFVKGSWKGRRAGRGPAPGAEGEARSRVPAVEPRKPGNNPSAAELCEVSRSASSPVFIYSARVSVCAWPRGGEAGGVVRKPKRSGGGESGAEGAPCRLKAPEKSFGAWLPVGISFSFHLPRSSQGNWSFGRCFE